MSRGILLRLLLLLLLMAGPLSAAAGCEERFSSTPPLGPDSLSPAPSSSSVDALFPTTLAEAGSFPVELSHALTVTLCSSSGRACPAADPEAGYHVVFGSGRGAVRTRGQAMADLYKELRDRTGSGERLDAEAHTPGDGGTPLSMGGGSSSKPGASDDDPLSQCAFQLLDLVDGVGEVTLDVIHGSGAHGCQVSLGRTADGGAARCLVQEPERTRRPGRR